MLTSEHMAAAQAALREGGLLIDSIDFDGQMHRVPVDGKPNGKDGAYIAYSDAPVSVWWHNWRSGETNSTPVGQHGLRDVALVNFLPPCSTHESHKAPSHQLRQFRDSR